MVSYRAVPWAEFGGSAFWAKTAPTLRPAASRGCPELAAVAVHQTRSSVGWKHEVLGQEDGSGCSSGLRHVAHPCSIVLPRKQLLPLRVPGWGSWGCPPAAAGRDPGSKRSTLWCGARAGAGGHCCGRRHCCCRWLRAAAGGVEQPKHGNRARAVLPCAAVRGRAVPCRAVETVPRCRLPCRAVPCCRMP